MKNFDEYLFEKLIINKDVKVNEPNPEDPSTWGPGDILVGVFSYSMTLVRFFKIERRTAKKFDVVELGQKITSGNGMQGECIADETKEGKKHSGRLNKWNSLVIDSYRCHLWDGKPEFFTHLD